VKGEDSQFGKGEWNSKVRFVGKGRLTCGPWGAKKLAGHGL